MTDSSRRSTSYKFYLLLKACITQKRTESAAPWHALWEKKMSSRKRRLDVSDAYESQKKQHTEGINPYTGQKYSSRYYEILQKRMELPVFEQKEDFFQNLRNNQVIVLQGETGSGRDTSCSTKFMQERQHKSRSSFWNLASSNPIK